MGLSLEQHAIRRTGLTATDVVALAGFDLYGRTQCDVWADKCLPPAKPKPDSIATRIGHALEPLNLQLMAEQFGLLIARTGTIRSRAYPWALATPDGICLEAPIVIGDDSIEPPGPRLLGPSTRIAPAMDRPALATSEIATVYPDLILDFRCAAACEAKAVGGFMRHHWEAGLPHSVNVQLHWQMIVCGVSRGYVGALIGHEHQVFVVERDDGLCTALLTLADRFWRHNVLAGQAPTPDGSDGSDRMLKAMFPKPIEMRTVSAPAETESWALQYAQASADLKRAEAAKLEARDRLRLAIGHQEAIESPNFFASWKWSAKTSRRNFYFKAKAGDALAAAKSAPMLPGDNDE